MAAYSEISKVAACKVSAQLSSGQLTDPANAVREHLICSRVICAHHTLAEACNQIGLAAPHAEGQVMQDIP